MRFSYFPILAVLVLLSLSACSTFAPSPMGRGYSSYDKVYKSADGSESLPIGYEYSESKNNAVMNDIKMISKSLVEKLDEEIAFSVDSVYLDIPAEKSPFFAAFDHSLRSELTRQGYLLTVDKSKGMPVTFIAQKPKTKVAGNLPEDYKMLFLALGMDEENGKPKTVLGNFYKVPAYGFSPTGPDVDQLVFSDEKEKAPCMKKETCSKCADNKKPCCANKDKPCMKEKPCAKEKPCKKDKPCDDKKKCKSSEKPKEICNRLCSKDCDKSCGGKCDKPCEK